MRMGPSALMLQETKQLSEAEGLSGRYVVIHLKFTRLTRYLHPSLRTVFGNYLLPTYLRLSHRNVTAAS